MSIDFFLLVLLLIPAIFVSKVPNSLTGFFKNNNILGSWSISLSAVATNHSAFVYLGQIGFTYTYGLESLWLTLGWKLGDWFSMLCLQNKIKSIIERHNIFSLSELITINESSQYSKLQIFFGSLTVLGLVLYASAQLIALDKVISFFDIKYNFSIIIIICAMVVYYLNRGGFEASIKTDVVQAFIIFLTVCVLFYFSIEHIGGLSSFLNSVLLHNTETHLLKDPYDLGEKTALFLFLIGWFFAGAGTLGQPHMLMRFMAAKNTRILRSTQLKYIVISSLFSVPILGLAFAARQIIPFQKMVDPELALLVIAQEFFPYFLVLVLIYGIMAAAMSTLDSVVIAISTIVSKDITPCLATITISPRQSTFLAMAGVLGFWFVSSAGVFTTVISSWSLVAGIYLPIIIFTLIGVKTKAFDLFIGAIISIAVQIAWKLNGLDTVIYNLFPTVIVFLLCSWLSMKLTSLK